MSKALQAQRGRAAAHTARPHSSARARSSGPAWLGVQVQFPQGDWHGAHTRRMAETLSLICLATAGLFMV